MGEPRTRLPPDAGSASSTPIRHLPKAPPRGKRSESLEEPAGLGSRVMALGLRRRLCRPFGTAHRAPRRSRPAPRGASSPTLSPLCLLTRRVHRVPHCHLGGCPAALGVGLGSSWGFAWRCLCRWRPGGARQALSLRMVSALSSSALGTQVGHFKASLTVPGGGTGQVA